MTGDSEIIFREPISGEVPAYAILSHTWGEEEVFYQDLKRARTILTGSMQQSGFLVGTVQLRALCQTCYFVASLQNSSAQNKHYFLHVLSLPSLFHHPSKSVSIRNAILPLYPQNVVEVVSLCQFWPLW